MKGTNRSLRATGVQLPALKLGSATHIVPGVEYRSFEDVVEHVSLEFAPGRSTFSTSTGLHKVGDVRVPGSPVMGDVKGIEPGRVRTGRWAEKLGRAALELVPDLTPRQIAASADAWHAEALRLATAAPR